VRIRRPAPAGKPPAVDRPQKPLGKAFFVGSVTIAVTSAATLIALALRGVPTDEFGYAPHLLVILVVAIFVIASLAITEIIPWHSRSLRDWSRPKVLGSFVGLIMGALGLAAGVTPIFNPPAATEESLQAVRKQLEAGGITRGVASLVEAHIAGIWGEPGCQVTYNFALDKGLLTVTSIKSVTGQSPLMLELQAEPGVGGRLVSSVLMPLPQRGDQHEFLYEKAGAREFLTWVIKKREISLKLDRCAEG
jgi:hypothetical protein